MLRFGRAAIAASVSTLVLATPSSIQLASAQDLCSIVPGNYATAKSTYPHLASAISEVQKHSVATWYSDRNEDYIGTLEKLVATCPESSRLSVVVYGLPNKDCEAGYSNSGTVKTAADYVAFLNTLTGIVGSRKVLYVLEPDAVGLLGKASGCAEQSGYRENIKTAIRLLSANANADIYLDVGYWTLQWPDSTTQVASTVKSLVGAGRVKGVAINTSNYRSSAEVSGLCLNFQSAMGSTAYRCVVDTSRNFVAPTSAEWCNVKTAGIGSPPTTATGYWNLDYFMWIKVPGESDGRCNDGTHTGDSLAGPEPSVFFAKHFQLLWDQGYFVEKLGFPKIGAAKLDAAPCASSYGSCGSAAHGAGCCAASSEYCQPWNPTSYQCRPAPLLCGTQQVGVDFYGDDLATIYSIPPEECCARCAGTDGCRAYTFVNYNSDGRAACFLKKSTGARRDVVGAVSAEVLSPKVPAAPACATPMGDYCGNAQGSKCCPSGAYCQPWNRGYYQCIQTPQKCSQQFTDVDFYGNDIATVYNVSPAGCCAKCGETPGCEAYTFVSEGTPACYLKRSTDGRRATTGAVSGVLN